MSGTLFPAMIRPGDLVSVEFDDTLYVVIRETMTTTAGRLWGCVPTGFAYEPDGTPIYYEFLESWLKKV